MKTKVREFKVGDVVRYDSDFLSSVGLQRLLRAKGHVVGFGPRFAGEHYLVEVYWKANGDFGLSSHLPARILSANLRKV